MGFSGSLESVVCGAKISVKADSDTQLINLEDYLQHLGKRGR